jgi:surface antigen
MAGLAAHRAGYSRCVAPRLWQRLRWRRLRSLLQWAGVAGMTCAVAGCSVTTQLGSVVGKDKPEGTASIPSQPLADPAVLLNATDLTAVRTAAAAMLDAGETGTQWENPATGARGTITPIASNYSQGGMQCRDFLASYVREQSESWLEGEACSDPSGRWEVRSLTPWKRS